MEKRRDPKNRRFALTVVILLAVALLLLSGCAYVVTPNRLVPATATATLLPLSVSA